MNIIYDRPLYVYWNLRHAFMLHLISCVAAPGHGNPPWLAGGLLHIRILVFWPPPQLRLHLPYWPQLLHPPFTGDIWLKIYNHMPKVYF